MNELDGSGPDPPPPLGLFEGYGMEIEYVIADTDSLDVRPIAHSVLESMGANSEGVAVCGAVAWSNELAAHVIELKTNGPVSDLDAAGAAFADAVREMNARLEGYGACLLPSGMHPWMNPEREFQLYPVDVGGYYRAFNRIFDCRGHGWSNLQSVHLNLPFASDAEFAKLHAAIRLLLPIMPALSASSPFVEGVAQAELDHRLLVYRDNAARVPSVSGKVVPEHVETRASYERNLLGAIYEDLRAHDPEGVLRYEWVNARGCIARFDRMALEIRVLDSQEFPRGDIAVARAIACVLRQACASQRLLLASRNWSEARLAKILWSVAREADQCAIYDGEYLALWGIEGTGVTAGELWLHLLRDVASDPTLADARWLLEHGCLARRIKQRVGPRPNRAALLGTYQELRQCLQTNQWFGG
jgi:gamma-glutamyl:cysteine ligase YbdK (ATP-grasp superfamily)